FYLNEYRKYNSVIKIHQYFHTFPSIKPILCFIFAFPFSKGCIPWFHKEELGIQKTLNNSIIRSRGRVARQRSAKPCTAVRIRPRPQFSKYILPLKAFRIAPT